MEEEKAPPKEKKYQYKTLKEFMVASFKGLQSAVSKQMTEHNKYKTANADKFATINKKVDIDMKKTLKDMNITSDDLNKRVHMLQKDQVEPL